MNTLGCRKSLQTPHNGVFLWVSAVAKKDFESHPKLILRRELGQGTKIIRMCLAMRDLSERRIQKENPARTPYWPETVSIADVDVGATSLRSAK